MQSRSVPDFDPWKCWWWLVHPHRSSPPPALILHTSPPSSSSSLSQGLTPGLTFSGVLFFPVPFVGDLAAVGTSHCSRSGCGCRSGLFRAALSCSQPPSHHPAPALLSTLDSAVLCRAFFCTIFLKSFWHVGMIYTQLLESCLFLHSNKLNKHIRAKNRPRKTFTAAFMSLSSSE